MKRILLFLLGLFLLAKPVLGANFPAPTGYVNDFAGILNESQKNDIESSLRSFKNQTGNEIGVVIIKDLGGDTVENVAVRMFEQWKLGQKGRDNGVLLLISMADRKLRIEVGYGLEPVLTDARSGDIIRNTIAPKFKQNDYYGGIKDGVAAIEDAIADAATPAKKDISGAIFGGLITIGIFGWFLIPVFIYLAAFLGRSKRIWPGGLVGLIIGAVILGIAGAIIVGLVGLFLDWILSRNYERLKKLGKGTGFWHSGGGFWSGGSSGGSSGGFGGFSGGSSGGGGSSGNW